MNRVTIYAIECKVNNKVYIGQTIIHHIRIKEHFNDLKKGNHMNAWLQNDYIAYGVDAFETYILEETTEDQSDDIEVNLIKSLMNDGKCYNMSLARPCRDRAYQAKTFTVISPSGEIITATNISQFSRDNDLNARSMTSLVSGERKTYKGWTAVNG